MATGTRKRLAGGFLSVLIFCFAVSAATSYTNYLYTRNIVLNTKASGANIASGTNVAKFPVLVRLSGLPTNNTATVNGVAAYKADSAVFAQALSTGVDVRFAKYDGTPFAFQRMRWDAANKLAEFWVLADTVFGGDSTGKSPTGYMNMFWGNGGASDTSSGAKVFDSATNNYQAVWHLQDTTDASSSGFSLTGSAKPVAAGSAVKGGMIGVADSFNGTSQYLKAVDSSSAKEIARLCLPFGGPFTLSAWVNYRVLGTTGGGEVAAGCGDNSGYMIGSAYNNVQFNLQDCGANSAGIVGNNNWQGYTPTTGTWYHVAYVRNTAGTAPYADTLYVNGALQTTAYSTYQAASTYRRNQVNGFKVGVLGDSADGALSRWFNGKIQEVQLSNVPRTSSWVRLSWANQCQPSIGTGVDSLTVKGPALANAPAAPVLISPTNTSLRQSSTALTLYWNSAAGATSYVVMLSSSSGASFFTSTVFSTTITSPSGQTISAALPTLNGGQEYYWQVQSSNGTATTWSSTWSFATATPFGQTNLYSPASGTISVPVLPTLTWNAVTSATSYEVQISSGADVTVSSPFYDSTIATATVSDLYSRAALPNLTTYYWRVNAYNAGNPAPAGGGWSAVWTFTTVVAAPGAPSVSSPANGAVNDSLSPNLSLSWTAGSGGAIASYAIVVSTSSSFSNSVYSQTGITSGTSVVPTGITLNNTTYYWEVQATNANSSVWSGAWSFTTIIAQPGAPTTPSPANAATGQGNPTLTLSWGTGAGGAPATYNLNLSTSSTFSSTFASSIGTTSYTVSSLAAATTYYWQVQAVNANYSPSAWSTIWSFTTGENYGTWPDSTHITLNTTSTGANTSTTVNNFPVLLRLTSVNASAFFANEVITGLNGADLRFADAQNGNHLSYELNKINVAAQTALVWVDMDQIQPNNNSQAITMYWGKAGAVSQSDSANVFVPANGFGAVLHLNKRYSSGTYNVFSDATGSGNIGNGSNTLGDTTCAVGAGLPGCAFDSAACFHLTGPGNNILSGDSIQIASLLGNHSAITMSAWIRTDSLDQYNTGVDGHQGTLISMADYDNLCVGGAYGTGTDSLIAAWSNGSAWANYGWPSTSLTGTNPQLNQSNTSGHAIGTHTGWKYVAFALNPSATTPIEKLYVNGDSVRNIGVANTLGWSGGNGGSGYRTVLGKQATTANVGERFGGSMVEMRIDTTIRSSDWIHLCYENQGAADYLTNPPPQPPTLSSPSNGAAPYLTSSLSLSWTATAGPSATSYQVQVSTVNTFASTVYQNLNVTSGTSVVPTGLAVSKLYYWEVSASNSGGASAWSSIWSFTPQQIPAPAAPTLATPTNGATGEPLSLNLTWGTVSTAATYGVQVSTTSTFSNTVSSQSGLAGTTAAISGLGYFTTYYWEASATNAGGTTWSGVQSFTTMPSTPTVPTLALPASGTQSEPTALTLSWTSGSFDSSYAVQISTGSGFGTTVTAQWGLTSTSASINGLTTLTGYYWRVGAKNSNGVSGWTGAWSFATASHFPAPLNTGNNMTVLVRSAINPTVNGVPIQNGDEIAVFNHSGYCAGTTVWEDTVAADSNAYISVWGQTTVNNQTEPGMASGEVLLYRIWDAVNSKEMPANVAYASPSVNHDANDTNVFITGGNSILASLAAATVPAVPTLASPTTGTTFVATAPTLSWNSVSTATSYAVQVSMVSGFGTTLTAQWGLTGTSASITGLAGSTNYFWRVGAKNVGGVSGWSNIWSFTTIAGVPNAPTLVSPGNDSLNAPTSLALSWSTVTNAATYAVQVSLASGFGSTVTAQWGLTGTSATISGLANSTTYFWRAGAKNPSGVSGWSAPYSFTTIIAAPGVPTLVTPANDSLNTPTSLVLNWGTVTNAATYAVQVSLTSGFGSTVTAQWGLTGTSASISGLANSTTYFWRAGAKDLGGVSGWSAPYSFTTIIAAPGVPTLVSPANDSLNAPTSLVLNWTTVANAASYAVQVSLTSGFGSTVTAQWGLTGTSASISGLANATTYFWRAGAKDISGVSGWSAPYSFTTIIAAPGIPTLVSPANDSLNTPTSLVLSWTTVTNAATYAVQVSLTSGFGSTVTAQWGLTGTSASISGLANATTYFWRAGAKDLGGTSGWSAPYSFTTIVAAPGVPTLVTPANDSLNTPTSLVLNWTTVANAASYAVQVSLTSGFGSTVTAQWGLTGTSATVAGLANATTYFWRAGAKDLAGVSGWSAPYSFTTIPSVPGATPTLVSPASGTSNAPTSLALSWTTVTNAATYAVQVSTDAGFGSTVTAQWGLTGTSASITGLANATTYFWRAGAKDLGGTSGWSAPYSFTTIVAAPGVPTLVTPANDSLNAPTSLVLNWTTVANAASYAVQVSLTSGFGSTVTAQWGLTGTSASISGLANATTYFWRAGAKDISGVSGWSAPYSFTTIIAAPGIPTLVSPANDSLNTPTSLVLSWTTVTNAATYAVQVSLTSGFGSTVTAQWGLTGTSASISGLANATTYFWRAGAKDLGGTSGWSAPYSFTTIVAAPGVPTLVTPANDSLNTPTSLVLNWTTVANAASYAVQVSLTSGFGSTVTAQWGLTGTSATVAGLANATTYFWRAGAKDLAGVSGWSAPYSFTTIPSVPGATPTLVSPASGTSNAPTSLALSWTTVTNAATYAVQVSTDAGFGSTVTAQWGLTGTSASITGLANATTYFWRAGAKDLGGTSGWSAPYSFTTIVAAPGVPTLVTPANDSLNTPTSLVLNWTTVANAASYAVQVSLTSGFGSTVTAQWGLTGTSATVAGLANATTYFWRAGAKDLAGVSGWSAPYSFTTIPSVPGATPTLVSPASGTSNAPTSLALSWTTVTNAATYAVQVSTDAGFGRTVTAQWGLTGTSASITGLANATTYFWRAGAKDLGGTSGWSAPYSFTTIVAAPGVPTLVTPANDSLNTPTSLVLNWTTVANAASYAVQVSLTSGFGSTVTAQWGLTGTSATVAGLANATTYFWRAGAKDLAGVSGWSAPYSFTTIVAAPGVPTLVTPANDSLNTPTSLVLNWTTVANAASYAVQVSLTSGFGSTVTAQWGLTGTSATVAGLANATTYFWRAGAKDLAGVSGWSAPYSFTTIPSVPGATPTLVSPASGTSNAPTSLALSWTTVTNAATYAVQVSTDAGFGSTVTAQWGLTGTSASITGLANATTYFWRAGAKNIGGVSGWSGAWSFTTIIAAPATPTLATPTSGSVNQPISLSLNWGAVTNAASYSVMVSTAANFATTVSSQTGLTGVTAALSGLANSATYYWEVNAANIGGTSSWSAAWSFSTIVATPAVPALATPSSGTVNESTSPDLTWGAVSGAASYNIMVSTAANFATTVSSQTGLTGVAAPLAGLANLTTYYWEVNAANIGGTSGWSGAWSFTTIIAAPAMPTLTTPTRGSVNQPISLSLNWGAVTNAASYSVIVSTAANFATTVSSQTGLTGVTAALSGLANSATYYWEVNAANIGGTSLWSGAWSFSTIVETPAVPTLVTPSSGSVNEPTSLALSWGAVTNAATYAVQVSTDAGFGSTVTAQWGLTGTSASISGLANSTTYFWRAGAKDLGGTSGWSGAWSFTTIIATPVTPTLATPTSGSVNQPISLSLNWGAVTNAASYSLMVSTAANFATTVSSQTGLTGVTAALSGLANSATYYWEVNAANIGGTSLWSGAWSFSTIVETPAVPTLVTPSSGSVNEPTSLALSWGAVTNAATYAVQVSTDAGFGSTVTAQWGLTGTSASISGLANSTTYFWRAGAKDLGGTSGWSGAWSFTTIIATPVTPMLATPASGTVNESTSPALAWGAVSGAASYTIMLSTAANFATTVSSQTGLTGVAAPLAGLANLTTYYWEVNAANIGGTSGWSGAWSFTTIIAAPVAPSLATPTSGAVNQPISLSLNWGAVTGAASYSVLVSTAVNFATTVSSQVGLTGVSASLAGLANGTTFYWEVNAANIGGTSLWSTAWNFTTIVAAPATPSLASPASGAIDEPVSLSLNWGAVTGATSYTLMVSTAANFATTVLSQPGLTGTTASVSGLASGGTYYWEVNAANIGGTSAWSGVWNFTTLVNFSLIVQPGWNMISFNIRPADSNAVKVFGDSTAVANNHNFILVKNLAGYIYCPTLGISDSIVIQTGVGLQMYSGLLDTVRTAGSAIPAFSTPIPLLKGWNLTGYLPPTTESITTALSSISSQLMLVKDNSGEIYWPEYGIDAIDTLAVGQGYFIYMTSSAPLTYSVAKRLANAVPLLRLPKTTHYAKHANTGNNASVLATLVSFGNKVAPDSCEIGAFDGSGTLVGSGAVIHGLAAFSVWGKNIQTKSKDGLGASEKITFKMWNKTKEYPVEFKSANGSAVSYTPQAVFLGSLAVPEGALITEFNLAKVYPNPFHGFVQVAFDVPTINGVAAHNVEINVFNMKGSLVHQLARGKYNAGHYVVSWGGESAGSAVAASGIYVIQMKADNFDKRLKLVKVQ